MLVAAGSQIETCIFLHFFPIFPLSHQNLPSNSPLHHQVSLLNSFFALSASVSHSAPGTGTQLSPCLSGFSWLRHGPTAHTAVSYCT